MEEMKNVPKYYGEVIWADKLPHGDLELYEDNLLEFFEIMVKRQQIWLNRISKPEDKVVVDDKFLVNNKFTNVYRELDRNSQYTISQIILDDELDDVTLVWKIIFYRIFNNPNTFQYIERTRGHKAGIPDLVNWNREDFIQAVKEIRSGANGDTNPFTNAYLINSMACPGKTRDYCYTEKVIPTVFERIFEIYYAMQTMDNPNTFIKLLEELPGVSGFISHELYQDFTYIERYTDRKIFKWNQDDFTNVGPGCDLGLRLIFPSTSKKAEKLKKIYELRDIANSGILEDLGFDFLNFDKETKKYYTSKEGKVSLHQIEMWLCEYQKYWKMKIGEGKQRSKFISKEGEKDYSFYLY